MRRSLVIGNWKMNGNLASAQSLAQGIIAGLGADIGDIAVCVPYVYLASVGEITKGSRLGLGSQNVADKASGAYTGEISASMLKEFNCQMLWLDIQKDVATTVTPTHPLLPVFARHRNKESSPFCA